MKAKILQIIVYIGILAGIYFFVKKFPEQSIIIFGIGLILIVGNWMAQSDRDNN
jgi:glucose uptake protein GlcU